MTMTNDSTKQQDEDVTMTEAASDPKDLKTQSSLGSLPDHLAQGNMLDDTSFTLVAKFGKERITLSKLPADTTIASVKDKLAQQTRILPKRQKLVGLVPKPGTGSKQLSDDLTLDQIKPKKGDAARTFTFILMGTPEEEIFVDPHHREDLPDVIDDFDLDFNAGSDQWLRHVANGENLKKFTAATRVFLMNQPRPGKPLLVLDLDHTLLDFSSRALQQDGSTLTVGQGMAAAMKRPHMDEFLTQCYQHYDLVVWSQTSWRWLETKLTELGMLTHPGYNFCFVLDKTSMFTVVSTKRNGSSVTHHVKPLQIIWSKFAERWGSYNTVHLDDLARNFALNLQSGLKCTAYHRKSGKRDNELLGLGRYLVQLAQARVNFDLVDFGKWMDVVQGKCPLVEEPNNGDGEEESSNNSH